jgi:hypothetical protein
MRRVGKESEPENERNALEPQHPARAFRAVPGDKFLDRLLRRKVLIPLPQYDPTEHAGQNFDFNYLQATGAIRPDSRSTFPIPSLPETSHIEISDQAGALALRNLAEQEQRGKTEPPSDAAQNQQS